MLTNINGVGYEGSSYRATDCPIPFAHGARRPRGAWLRRTGTSAPWHSIIEGIDGSLISSGPMPDDVWPVLIRMAVEGSP
jgi:hypothetical protein